MKRILLLCSALLLLLSLGLGLISCGADGSRDSMEFGKRYLSYQTDPHDLNEEQYYVFNADHTGYCEYKYTFLGSLESYTVSGRVEFEWREASNGAIYLFRTKTHYNEDHDANALYDVPLISQPIYFSEEFFCYENPSTSPRYVLEDSDLAKKIAKK